MPADRMPARRMPGAGFRGALWGLVGGLTLLCLVLAAINVLNGPRLTGFDVDPARVVAEADQRLVLDTNQKLSDVQPDQVTISPAAPISVQSSNDSIVISFPRPLAYDTEYTVNVDAVTGPASDRPSSFDLSFHTEEPALHYLSRTPPAADGSVDPTKPDRILRTSTGSSTSTVAWQSPYIQEFVALGEELVVATVNEDRTTTLSLVDKEGNAEELTLPGAGTVEDLQIARAQSLLGFRFTSDPDATGPKYDNTLFLLDLGTGVANPVPGLDGEPVQALAWGFMPGRAELVVQRYDTTMLLINPLGTKDPIPIGQFSGLAAFAPDGERIIVTDQDSQRVLDLSQGTEEKITPQEVVGTTPYTAELKLLAGRKAFVQRLTEFDPKSGSPRQYLTLVSGSKSRVIYAPDSARENIVGFSISPNDQYLAVQIVPNRDTALLDGYPVGPQATTATTLFIDLETGRLTRSVVGFGAAW